MMFRFGEFIADPERFELRRGSSPVHVEPQVLGVLIHLLRNRNRMVTKDDLIDAVWSGRAVSDASIASRVRAARASVGDDGARQAVIRTVHGRGFRFVAQVDELPSAAPNGFTGSMAADPNPARGQPSIAVLPFAGAGLPPELAILADALPHEIILAVSRLRWLAVIARGSSFRFRHMPDVTDVAAVLNVRYVLCGTVEIAGPNIAVVLELADGGDGRVIWADRLESPVRELAELRARIVAELVAAMEIHVPFNEARIAQAGGLDQLDAWAQYHIGLQYLYHFTAWDNAAASDSFRRAIALDPHFARAHAGLSFTSFLDAFLRLCPDKQGAVRAARHHAERGLELDALDPFANFTMGRSFWLTDEPAVAAEWLARATAFNPNYAQGFYASAFTAMLVGDAPATVAALDTSLRLSPLDPLLYGVHGVRAQILIQQEDYRAAARWADRAATTPGAHYLIAMIALAANGLAGCHDQAVRWRREVSRRKPDATAADYFAAFPTRDTASRRRIAEELRRHGF